MDELVPPPTMSSLPAVDHLGLFGAFREAFDLHLRSMQWPKESWPIFVQTFPKEREGKFDTTFDVILFHIVHCETATTSNDRDRKPTGLSAQARQKHPTKAGYIQETIGWQETVTVQFTVIAKSNERANELALWFHRMIMRYAHSMKFFVARGITRLVFKERLEDVMTKDFGQELYKRPLLYDLRLDLFEVVEAKTLDAVSIVGQSVQIRQ